ncbi:MAG: pyridoxamine 5'-phosphate oxidase family protein [Promethearchaeota archaeon]
MTVLRLDGFDYNEMFFVTNSNSAKIKDILQNNNIEIYISPPMASGFYQIKGKAFIENNNEIKKKLWHNLFFNWIPAGVKSQNYTYLRVKLDVESLTKSASEKK